jgi:hypothetical protein
MENLNSNLYKQDILDMLNKQDFTAIEARYVQNKFEQTVNINTGESEPNLRIEKFLEIAKLHEVKFIYYTFIVFDKEDYYIDEFLLQELTEYNPTRYNEKTYKAIEKEIEKHNIKIAKVNDGILQNILLFFITNGHVFFDIVDNENISEFMEKEDKIDSLIEEFGGEILNSIANDKKKDRDTRKKWLIDFLLNDDQYMKLSNNPARQHYILNKSEDNPEILEVLRSYGLPRRDTMAIITNEIKAKKRVKQE